MDQEKAKELMQQMDQQYQKGLQAALRGEGVIESVEGAPTYAGVVAGGGAGQCS